MKACPPAWYLHFYRGGFLHGAGAIVVCLLGAVPSQSYAFDILAKLDREGNSVSGPTAHACETCENKGTRVSVDFLTGFAPLPILAAEPSNSQIGGRASVDLQTGQLRGRALASAFGHLESHKMGFAVRLRETLKVTFPAGLPENQRVVTIVGLGHGSAIASGIGAASLDFSLEVNGVRGAGSQSSPDVWTIVDGEGKPGVSTALNGASGCRIAITVKPPASGEVAVTAELSGTTLAMGQLGIGSGVAEANALNTAELGVELPGGATFTSTSGVFLAPPPPPAIALAVEGGELVISFDGVLEASTGLGQGGWSAVEGAVSPHRIVLPLAGARFFRARAP